MTEVTYKFADLSEKAKQHARETMTGEGYLEYDWWDSIYEDAERVGHIIGIAFNNKGTSKNPVPEIYFSGFSSQGDGAAFAGHYGFEADASVKIREYCKDEELFRIVDELALIQVTRRLKGLSHFTASITCSHRHYSVDVEMHSNDDDDVSLWEVEDEVKTLMQDFANWIYKQLEAENDWLYSDECVDPQLEDSEFDEDGNVI